MKTRLFILLSIFCTGFTNAQFAQQWLNNFCCFDSLGPHSFSYPLGREFNQDTLTISFYEDGYLNFKRINTATGNDIQNITLVSDTIQPPFYFGGGTTKISNQYFTSCLKYNNNSGQSKLFHSSVSELFTVNWSKYHHP
jgi:hypothetical protein